MEVELVYIVEDDSIACYVITKQLDRHDGFRKSQSFKHGEEALNALIKNVNQQEFIPDLIFLDINMPVMDGWEFLEAFSKLTYDKNISVIILTSSINPEDKERAKTYDVVKGFMSKPLTGDKLDQVLLLI